MLLPSKYHMLHELFVVVIIVAIVWPVVFVAVVVMVAYHLWSEYILVHTYIDFLYICRFISKYSHTKTFINEGIWKSYVGI